MTKEPIMIDDVDVKDCEHCEIITGFLKDKRIAVCGAFFLENEDDKANCRKYPNCYYKQLKRKEQECEEWAKKYDQLKAENEKLKTGNTILQNRNQQMSGCITQNEIYKQALQEIKEIAFPKNQLIITDSPIILKIREKISEVE